jgi:hypothetical protein
MPIIPALQEANAEGSLEPQGSRSAWTNNRTPISQNNNIVKGMDEILNIHLTKNYDTGHAW